MSEDGQADGGNKSSVAEGADSLQQDASTHTSQTHLGQMTASSVAPPDSEKWSCEICTYENFPLSRKCTMCRSPKPCLNEDIFKLQDGASALPPSDVAESLSERVRPLRMSSPPAAASASETAKWSCPTCTYENWPKTQKCAMCGATTNEIPDNTHTERIESVVADVDSKSRRRNNHDWLWLQACLGVVEGRRGAVRRYLRAGGSAARALAPHELALLARPSAFDAGHTLVHLAIRFQRQDILSMLLSRISGGGPGLKRSPSYVSPELGVAIRRHIASCMRRSKGSFPANFINEFQTFCIPAEVEELPLGAQELLFSELLDRDAQDTLEGDPHLINWSHDLTLHRGSRLHALWNRSAGDCLPDAVCQAAYGVFDRNNLLRAAMADTLVHAQRSLYPRWAAWEEWQAALLQYSAEETQRRAEWSRLTANATRPGTALHQIHVFVLAHVMRRPIIVYGVNVVHSFRGEPLGYARFQGIYLPVLWEPEFCSKSPLCLGYTRGHFSALVPIEPYSRQSHYICRSQEEEDSDEEECTYVPLTDCDGKLLPVHFLTCDELSDEEGVVRRYTQAVPGAGGLLCRHTLHRRHPLVRQLLHAWLDHYRARADESRGPYPPRLSPPAADFSSDPDTDDD